mmetsp:Transcript_9150/g.20375  ORF Transcript_9150/g.20375 Transcript_9150/m.20375 type:complete len:117 (-) Transcript_9150:221-571(-)|eukprot:CAMPEP_0178442756 /NCGR_PEP_ID=MMETSP0689_2-20121128/38393_1 /TAXON_ID=160604 /ORGANISM="Amphidinium massartii, Strain CS-259" /LENGTH=116 /DNA_ID=CAMNT_0020066441 /DNA_START=21 /DNA_END=374 /DNA_ORIENTATION=+
MAEEVKLKIIFANDSATAELEVPMTTTVKELKRNIFDNYWPSSIPAAESAERLRLFAAGKEVGGKEADDGKTLREAKVPANPGYPTAVHVVVTVKAVEQVSEKETTKPSQCFCNVL